MAAFLFDERRTLVRQPLAIGLRSSAGSFQTQPIWSKSVSRRPPIYRLGRKQTPVGVEPTKEDILPRRKAQTYRLGRKQAPVGMEPTKEIIQPTRQVAAVRLGKKQFPVGVKPMKEIYQPNQQKNAEKGACRKSIGFALAAYRWTFCRRRH